MLGWKVQFYFYKLVVELVRSWRLFILDSPLSYSLLKASFSSLPSFPSFPANRFDSALMAGLKVQLSVSLSSFLSF
jgi:hypothetical protein